MKKKKKRNNEKKKTTVVTPWYPVSEVTGTERF
jgi:hypothetical protein